MKHINLTLTVVAVICIMVWLYIPASKPQAQQPKAAWHTDPQFAAGEWKIEVQTPPCDSVHNVQVIYPKESGAPITIECDSMPVPTR
jgi:hypothetical protein